VALPIGVEHRIISSHWAAKKMAIVWRKFIETLPALVLAHGFPGSGPWKDRFWPMLALASPTASGRAAAGRDRPKAGRLVETC